MVNKAKELVRNNVQSDAQSDAEFAESDAEFAEIWTGTGTRKQNLYKPKKGPPLTGGA